MAALKNDQKEPITMAKRFLAFCAAVLAGIVLLYLAMQLLSQFWGWLVLLGGLIAGIYVCVRILRARRNRW